MIENTTFSCGYVKSMSKCGKTEDINVTKCKYIFNKNLNNKLHSEIYYNDSIVISRNNIRKHYFTSSKSVVV